MGLEYAYIRVSTASQHEDRQLMALQEYQIPEANIFVDKQSGKDFKRPAYQMLLEKLQESDILYIKSIDRLGRNYSEILEQWRTITKEKRADIVVLDMPLLDTRKGKDLTGTLIADIVLQLLSYVSEQERLFIRARQAEGIAAAKARGVRFGRPRLIIDGLDDTIQAWTAGQISAQEAATKCGISVATFYRRAAQLREIKRCTKLR